MLSLFNDVRQTLGWRIRQKKGLAKAPESHSKKQHRNLTANMYLWLL